MIGLIFRCVPARHVSSSALFVRDAEDESFEVQQPPNPKESELGTWSWVWEFVVSSDDDPWPGATENAKIMALRLSINLPSFPFISRLDEL